MLFQMPFSNRPPRNGLILTEILVITGVILMVCGMTTGLAVSVAQRAVLTACLNNMRQLGIVDVTYAGDQRGFLALPRSNADQDLNRLWPDQLGIAAELSAFYLCPRFAPAQRADGTRRSDGATLSADERRSHWAAGTVGYALYRLAAAGPGQPCASAQGRGLWDTHLAEGFGASKAGARIVRNQQMEAGAVRLGEFYADCRAERDGRDLPGAANTGWFHTGSWASRPEGGNILCGDLSGRFSRNLIASHSGVLTLVAP